jgi:orotate phosphoribosyltransferase-like protein
MEKVITLYQNGKTFNEIAVECKVSKKDAIHYVLDTKYNINNN